MTNVTFENIRSKASLYGLDVDQYWQNKLTPDDGSVALRNLVFKNFSGTLTSTSTSAQRPANTRIGSVADGIRRPPLYLIANDLTFAENVTVEDFAIWTETGDYVVNQISNVFGYGDDSYGPNNGLVSLAATGTPAPYTSTYTVTASPTSWVAPSFPTWALPNTGYGSRSCLPATTYC